MLCDITRYTPTCIIMMKQKSTRYYERYIKMNFFYDNASLFDFQEEIIL